MDGTSGGGGGWRCVFSPFVHSLLGDERSDRKIIIIIIEIYTHDGSSLFNLN